MNIWERAQRGAGVRKSGRLGLALQLGDLERSRPCWNSSLEHEKLQEPLEAKSVAVAASMQEPRYKEAQEEPSSCWGLRSFDEAPECGCLHSALCQTEDNA